MIYDCNNAKHAKVFFYGQELDLVVRFDPDEGWAEVAVSGGLFDPVKDEFVNATIYGDITFEIPSRVDVRESIIGYIETPVYGDEE